MVSNGENNEGVSVRVQNQDFQVYPFEIFDGSVGLIVNNGEENYIGHQSKNEYLLTKSESVGLPNQLGKIIDIDYGGNFDLGNVSTKIEQSTGKVNTGTSVQPEFDFTGTGSVIDITWIKECEYRLVSKVENFISVFFRPNSVSQIEGFIEDAFNSCPAAYPDYQGNIPNRCINNCIDPRCVVDYLLDIDAGLGDSQKQFLVSQYLQEVLGLTDEEQNWLTLSGQSSLVFEMYNGLLNTQSLGFCENEDCGMVGGYHEVIKQTMAGGTFTASETTELLESFSALRCDNLGIYNCFREFQQNLVSEGTTTLMTLADCAALGSPPLQLPSCDEAFPFEEITGIYYAQTNFINLGF